MSDHVCKAVKNTVHFSIFYATKSHIYYVGCCSLYVGSYNGFVGCASDSWALADCAWVVEATVLDAKPLCGLPQTLHGVS